MAMTQEAGVDSGALLRLPVEESRWTEEVPPVPAGRSVTVSLRSPDRLRDRAALELLGYRVVSARPVSTRGDAVADFLVPQDMPDAHPRWWRALRVQAVNAFDLSFGPVQQALADVVRLHLADGAGG